MASVSLFLLSSRYSPFTFQLSEESITSSFFPSFAPSFLSFSASWKVYSVFYFAFVFLLSTTLSSSPSFAPSLFFFSASCNVYIVPVQCISLSSSYCPQIYLPFLPSRLPTFSPSFKVYIALFYFTLISTISISFPFLLA